MKGNGMANILDESILTLDEAAKSLPRLGGTAPAMSTVWRWCRRGFKSPAGAVVSLEYARLGKRMVTSREAIARFSARLPEADMNQCAKADDQD